MIKRLIKELWSERLLMAAVILCIFIADYALAALQTSGKLCEACILDAFSFVSRNMQSTIYLIVMIGAVAIMKNTYMPERVVRQKSLMSVWTYIFVKTGVLCLIFSVFNTLGTLLVGRSLSSELCVWDSSYSYFYYLTGFTMTDVNYALIVLVFMCSAFLGFFISALIPIITGWYMNSFLLGAFLCILINIVGENSNFKYDLKRDVSFARVLEGIDASYQFIYPVIVILLLFVLGCFKLKKDFLGGRNKS